MYIAILDLGVGNLRSVEQAVKTVAANCTVEVTADVARIDAADKIILPGQGAVGTWFDQLEARDLRASLESAKTSKPLLGICVGMQAMFDFCTEDGGREGLGWFEGRVEHFSGLQNQTLKIPQMGWNTVKQMQPHPLWHKIDDAAYLYFVHSYCANTSKPENVLASADYGHEFVAAVGADNIFATQFHPEKSHNDGLQLLRNFTEWDGGL